MRRLKSSLIVLVLTALCLAQGTNPLSNARVRRLGDQLMCLCGCGATVTSCNMLGCSHSKPMREKLLAMVNAGMSDQAILDQFKKDMGEDVVAVHPGVLGSISFYAAAVVGLILVLWVIRKYTRPAPVAPAGLADEAVLDRYHEQIEKEVEKLD